MRKSLKWIFTLMGIVACSFGLQACGSEGSENQEVLDLLNMRALDTYKDSASANAEIVRVVPDSNQVLLISSKNHALTLLDTKGGKLTYVASNRFGDNLSSENELTSADIVSNGVVALTQTIITMDGEKQTGCEGRLLFVEYGEDFIGEVIREVEVGAMPDAVAISPDGKWAITADERDGPDAWGKCMVKGIEPSVSIISLSEGVENAKRVATIHLTTNVQKQPREPEYVAIAANSDDVAITLQDSHEILMFKISELMPEGGDIDETDSRLKIIDLPANEEGAKPWPDGIEAIQVAGADYYVIAGEWNDCLITIDKDGKVVSNMRIQPRDVPSMYPYVSKSNAPKFSPDSLFSFTRDDQLFVSATLRHSGALIVYNYEDPANPKFAGIAKVGAIENGKIDEVGSTVRPEGISGDPKGLFLVTANEEESSVTLVEIK